MSKSKNILIISPFFYPEPISTGKFNTDMVLALRDQGHNVKVLCFHPFYPSWKVQKSNKKIEGIEIIRGGKNIFYSSKTFIRRIVLELSFAFFIIRKTLRHQRNLDIIIPVFPPSLAFYFLRFFINKKIKNVGMVHDLQEVYSKNKKSLIFKFLGKIINHVEKKSFNFCHQIIFLSQEMKTVAKKSYQINESKLIVQYPFVTINPDKKQTDDLKSIFTKENKHIVYSGALGEKQNPKELYNIFDYCSKEIPNTQYHFFSQGTQFEEIKNNNKNTKIHFHNLVSKENIEELYQHSFIQIIPQAKGTSKGSLPSKLPNLLAAECNILSITDKDSEIDKLFKKYNLRKVIYNWNRIEVSESIKEFLEDKNFNKQNQKEISKSLFNINSMINHILEV